jgi:hypothetical protein
VVLNASVDGQAAHKRGRSGLVILRELAQQVVDGRFGVAVVQPHEGGKLLQEVQHGVVMVACV